MKKGLLLINLGTPNAPSVRAVRAYLREFLSDPRVIDLPGLIRFILLYAFILPFRPKQSAHAYQVIWTPEGSPLLTGSLALTNKVQARLADTHQVALGMRYGEPSLLQALKTLETADEITIIPLFPHYASATTGSCLEWVSRYFSSKAIFPSLHIIRDFYQHPGFINAVSAQIKPHIDTHDYILFSYHGVPARHLSKIGCNPVCNEACPTPENQTAACYRAQCLHTTHLLATSLSLSSQQFSSAFQSRLGRTEWIKPYTDEELSILIQSGVKKLAVVCPSFTIDCLETLEEIGIRAKEQWHELGGETLTLIPCVNDSPLFVETLVALTRSSD